MNNKIIKAILILLLCSPFAQGQQKIDKETFEKLVDYANCKYVESFIEKHDKGKSDYYETYRKTLAQKLKEASLENLQDILSYSELSNQLNNNNPAKELAKKINERKAKYADYQDNISLINSLSTTGWNNIDLSQTAANIQNNILSNIVPTDKKSKNTKPVSEAEIVKTQTIQTSSQVEQLLTKINELHQHNDKLNNITDEMQKSLETFKLIVLGAFISLIPFLVIFFFLLKKNLRKYITTQVIKSERIEKTIVDKEIKPYVLSEKDIDIIVKRVLEQKRLSTGENQPHSVMIAKESTESTKSISKYLKGKSGKIFNRAENNPENSFFRLFNENEETAQFEFFGHEAEALARRIFSEDICIIVSGNYQNARSIVNTKPGKVKRVGEQWEVIEPLQIKLI